MVHSPRRVRGKPRRSSAGRSAKSSGILVWDSPNTKILQNTVILNGTFPSGAIDYRWGNGIVLANNLTDAPIWRREETSGRETNNVVVTELTVFADAAACDLHLAPKAQTV